MAGDEFDASESKQRPGGCTMCSVTPRLVPNPWKPEETGLCLGRDNWQNTLILGRYHLLWRVGRGSQSYCYRAQDSRTGCYVAVKVLRTNRGRSQALRALQQQVDVLRELQRDNLDDAPFAKIFQFSQDSTGQPGFDADGALCIVMELGQRTLRTVLEANFRDAQPLQPENVRRLARLVLTAIAALHQRGFVHLDVKPDNFVFCGGTLKLIDFEGSARSGTDLFARGRKGHLCFSIPYAAPEWLDMVAARSEEKKFLVKPTLDIWSTGLTLSELATLRLDDYCQAANSSAGLFVEDKRLLEKPKVSWPRVQAFDQNLSQLISEWMVVAEKDRLSAKTCLSHAFLTGDEQQLADEKLEAPNTDHDVEPVSETSIIKLHGESSAELSARR